MKNKKILIPWDDLPDNFKNKEVKYYYEIINKKQANLLAKRLFDLIISTIMIFLLSPVILVIGIIIKTSSKGPVFFLQTRVTTYGKTFKIFKFRSMVQNAENLGSKVTVENDSRITKIGSIIRKCRLDEIPQLFNIFLGQMSFVGTRPEVQRYTDKYENQMLATLLLPAGVTSLASIKFKDEEKLLTNVQDIDQTYIDKVLPQKMKYNLEYLEKFSFFYDVKIMIKTILAVIK